ncbi:MAG: hypothetical protein H0V66_03180 [Bdellovibrionales bacterium]|nr:hypothetical protein [Bdellovibrionales bacterium]
MKKILIVLTLMTSFIAKASFDEAALKALEPKEGEVEASRSCFREVESLGCRHPREDVDQFKACMENVFSSLTPTCKKMLGDLYRKKN